MKDLRESICALCGCDIVEAMEDYRSWRAGKELIVCGKCFMINRIMEEVINLGNNRRSRLQVPDGDVH